MGHHPDDGEKHDQNKTYVTSSMPITLMRAQAWNGAETQLYMLPDQHPLYDTVLEEHGHSWGPPRYVSTPFIIARVNPWYLFEESVR